MCGLDFGSCAHRYVDLNQKGQQFKLIILILERGFALHLHVHVADAWGKALVPTP